MIGLHRPCLLVLTLFVLCLGAAVAAPPAIHSQVFKPPVLTAADKVLIDKSALQAVPLDLAKYAHLVRPLHVDYSDNATYIRCQDYGGGCMVYATLYCADIINEWQAPYTPDLSWQYVLRTWDELYSNALRNNPDSEPPDLNMVFNPGVSSEGLCRSESDYLTLVAPNHPAIKAAKGDRMYWDPAPSAAAKAEAENYKFIISDPITPTVETLKTLLLAYGPVWAAGPWWWNGAHAMAFVGYDEAKKEFKGVDSAGDWKHQNGFWTIPYDKLEEYVTSLRTVQMLPANRWQGRWAYSSRIRITGAWRGTFSVNIGVQGQVPLTVYRTYGRMGDRPYAYGERLELDVPLPEYAAQFWPPKANAKWYLQVEDNDRDGRQGRIVEWVIARRYEDPNCGSVDRWKTQEYRYSRTTLIPDAKGDPLASPAPSPNNAPPAKRNSQPGIVTINLPEETTLQQRVTMAQVQLRSQIVFEPEKIALNAAGETVLPGKLTTIGNQPLVGKTVELHRLTSSGNINKPDEWVKIQTAQTDAQGAFQFKMKLPPLQNSRQVLGAAYRDAGGETLCSTLPLVQETGTPQWQQMNVPIFRLAPELDRPMPALRGLGR